MNGNQTPTRTERVGIGERISNVWHSRNRIARLTTLLTLGLVLNCCCVIIPLSTKGTSLASHAQVSSSAISSPALKDVRAPLLPAAPALSAGAESDQDRAGRALCRDFSAPTYVQWAGSAKAGRTCNP